MGVEEIVMVKKGCVGIEKILKVKGEVVEVKEDVLVCMNEVV